MSNDPDRARLPSRPMRAASSHHLFAPTLVTIKVGRLVAHQRGTAAVLNRARSHDTHRTGHTCLSTTPKYLHQ